MKIFLYCALLAALSSYSMHVSSDDDADIPLPKNIEMKNFATNRPPAPVANNSSSERSNSDDKKKEYKPICFGNMNKEPTGLYSQMYTLASVDKNSQEES